MKEWGSSTSVVISLITASTQIQWERSTAGLGGSRGIKKSLEDVSVPKSCSMNAQGAHGTRLKRKKDCLRAQKDRKTHDWPSACPRCSNVTICQFTRLKYYMAFTLEEICKEVKRIHLSIKNTLKTYVWCIWKIQQRRQKVFRALNILIYLRMLIGNNLNIINIYVCILHSRWSLYLLGIKSAAQAEFSNLVDQKVLIYFLRIIPTIRPITGFLYYIHSICYMFSNFP